MRLIAAALTAAFFMFASPVLAQTNCMKRAEWVEHLANKYGETPVSHGLTSGNGLVELFVAPEGGTWPLIITTPLGISCIFASGEHWRKTVPKLMKPTGQPI